MFDDWSGLLTRRTTPGQRIVAAWTLFVLLAAMGGIALLFSFQAAKPADAAQLRWIAFWSFGLATAVLAVKKAIAMFLDRQPIVRRLCKTNCPRRCKSVHYRC